MIDMPPKKTYDLTEVEFLDYVLAQSQSENPLFSDVDIKRFREMAGSAPKLEPGMSGGYRLMVYKNIEELLDSTWAARDKAFAVLKEAA